MSVAEALDGRVPANSAQFGGTEARTSPLPPLSISVVVPVFNRADCIVRCLESVAAQTYPVSEIIVVDDASNDRTIEIVQDWSRRRHMPVKIIPHADNRGGGAARNTGIAAATGEWIAFLDSDDLWHADKIEKQVRALADADPNVAMVYAGLRHFDGEGRVKHTFVPYLEGDLSDALYGQNLLCSASSFMIRKDVLERIGGFDESLPSCQDWDLWLRLSREAHFAAVPELLVDYDDSERARISMSQRDRFLGHCAILRKHTAKEAERQPEALASLHFTIGDILMMMNRPRAAERLLRAACKGQKFSARRAVSLTLARLRFDADRYAAVKGALTYARRKLKRESHELVKL